MAINDPYPSEGKETRVESKHQASQHFAGDVHDISEEMRNIQQSVAISHDISGGAHREKPKAPVQEIRPGATRNNPWWAR